MTNSPKPFNRPRRAGSHAAGMDKRYVVDTLARIISDVLRIEEDKIGPEIAIHKVATWNSLSHIELVVTIEEAFSIQLAEDDIVAMISVGEIRRILSERGVLPEK